MADMTLRDLIRCARDAGLRLERADEIDERKWTWERRLGGIADLYDDAPTVTVERPNGWWVTISREYVTVELGEDSATIANIAAALRLCGWDLAAVDRGEARNG